MTKAPSHATLSLKGRRTGTWAAILPRHWQGNPGAGGVSIMSGAGQPESWFRLPGILPSGISQPTPLEVELAVDLEGAGIA